MAPYGLGLSPWGTSLWAAPLFMRWLLVANCFLLPFHHLRNRHELEPLAPIAAEDAVTGFDAAAAVDAHAHMRAVVQQDDIATANLALGARNDFLSRLRFPVVTGDVPHHRLQPEGSHRAQRRRTPPATRRPEDLRFHAGGIKDGLSGLHQLAAQLGRLGKNQVGMAPGMAADGMTSSAV